jgi:hypothetical protein
VDLNSSASRFPTRFQNPRVLPNIQIELLLANQLPVRAQHIFNPHLQIFIQSVFHQRPVPCLSEITLTSRFKIVVHRIRNDIELVKLVVGIVKHFPGKDSDSPIDN